MHDQKYVMMDEELSSLIGFRFESNDEESLLWRGY